MTKCDAADCLEEAKYFSVPMQIFFCDDHTEYAVRMGLKSFVLLAK